MTDATDQWSRAKEFWHRLGPPLRPQNADILAVRDLLNSAPKRKEPWNILILGVTPEFAHYPWPEGSTIYALDQSQAMIDHVWPGNAEHAQLGDWCNMPFRNEMFDLLLCDGGLQLLSVEKRGALKAEIHRVLSDSGIFIVRTFGQQNHTLSLEEVVTGVDTGAITNLNELKVLVGTALQTTPTTGVALADIWRTLKNKFDSWEVLAKKLNQPLDLVTAINSYKDNHSRMSFMDGQYLTSFFTEQDAFATLKILTPSYAFGPCFQTVGLIKR